MILLISVKSTPFRERGSRFERTESSLGGLGTGGRRTFFFTDSSLNWVKKGFWECWEVWDLLSERKELWSNRLWHKLWYSFSFCFNIASNSSIFLRFFCRRSWAERYFSSNSSSTCRMSEYTETKSKSGRRSEFFSLERTWLSVCEQTSPKLTGKSYLSLIDKR